MNIGLTLIIPEDEEGSYQPLAVAGSLNEARETVAPQIRALKRINPVVHQKVWEVYIC